MLLFLEAFDNLQLTCFLELYCLFNLMHSSANHLIIYLSIADFDFTTKYNNVIKYSKLTIIKVYSSLRASSDL